MKTPTAFRLKAQGCPRRAGYSGCADSMLPQPHRGCVPFLPSPRHNPVGVDGPFRPGTQGCRYAPTLGFGPLPRWGNRCDRARHDRLVGLVDKLLALVPKLRTATSDAGRGPLQSAVTATDQQIDALVYGLYGLTDDEIKLVEGGA